ncbi:MAG: type II secretion system protein [Armatimonadetes bacterium]|nr:type II secretion system protein [Armatimonadota bacterium]
MARRGYTLLEVLTVVAILLLLATFLQPAFSESKLQGRIAASEMNLRQAYMAMQVYRNEWETVIYGTPFEMGYPKDPYYVHAPDPSIFKSPCYDHGKFQESDGYYYAFFGDETDQEEQGKWVQRFLGQTPLFVDMDCNEGDVDFNSPEVTKRAICVTLDGNIISRRKKGDLEMAVAEWFNK